MGAWIALVLFLAAGSAAGLDYNQINDTATSRTTAIDGVTVPAGAIGWRYLGPRNIEFVFGDGTHRQSSGGSGGVGSGGIVQAPQGQPQGQGGGRPISQPMAQVSGKSWQYQLLSKLGKTLAQCSASLIGRCRAITASHCLESAAGNSALETVLQAQKGGECNGSVTEEEGIVRFPVSFKGPMGDKPVQATAFLNGRYRDESNEDVAVIEWDCNEAPSDGLPVLALSEQQVNPNTSIQYDKTMGAAGTYSGMIVQPRTASGNMVTAINGQPVNKWDLRFDQHGASIQNGDSGAAIWALVGGKPTVVGVVSSFSSSGGTGASSGGAARVGEDTFIGRFLRLMAGRSHVASK